MVRYRGFVLIPQADLSWLIRPERSPMTILPFRAPASSLTDVKAGPGLNTAKRPVQSPKAAAAVLGGTGQGCSGRLGRRGTTTAASLERQHQGGPMVRALGAGPAGPAHTEGDPHHIGALHPLDTRS